MIVGNGEVVFMIDGTEFLSDRDITYTDNPQVSSLVSNQVIQRYVCSIGYSFITLTRLTVEALI